MSVGVSNCLPDIQKVLIISPASLKINWQREWVRWDVKRLTVGISGKNFPNTNVCIINYDILKKYRGELRQQEFDMLVVDECHYLKSGKADRTKEVFGGIKRGPDKKIIERITPILAKRSLFLSGTPILNKPKELWPMLKVLDPAGLGSDWFSFAKRYCELFEIERFDPAKGKVVHQGWKWDGAANLEELQTIMRERFMIRRLKKDVLKELPPKTRQIIVLDAKKGLTKLLEKERISYEEYVKTHGEETDPPAFTEMSKIRKEVAIAKIPYVIEYLKEVLNETDKVVCFVHHHEVFDAILAAFKTYAVGIDGRMDSKLRQKTVDRFQTDERIKLFVGGIHSAGVGLTLTAANICVFAEIDYVPAMLDQCCDRLHRIGQKNNVLCRFIVLNNSLDERIINIIVKKQEIINRAVSTN